MVDPNYGQSFQHAKENDKSAMGGRSGGLRSAGPAIVCVKFCKAWRS
jgi:hypothetical protein